MKLIVREKADAYTRLGPTTINLYVPKNSIPMWNATIERLWTDLAVLEQNGFLEEVSLNAHCYASNSDTPERTLLSLFGRMRSWLDTNDDETTTT